MRKYAKTPTVLQMEATECGAASLAMILAYYGREIPLEQMRAEVDVSRDGVSMKNIRRAAVRFGLTSRGYRYNDLDKLLEMPVPCIIHWDMNHFVVFEGIKGNYAYINDPAFGRRKLTMEELEEGYSCCILTFEKTESFVPGKIRKQTFKQISEKLRGQGGVMFKLLYVGILLVFPGLVLPVLSQVFLDDVLGKGFTDWLAQLLVFIAGSLMLKVSLDFYRSVLLQKFKSSLTLSHERHFLEHLFRLPIPFFGQRYAGDLVERIDDHGELMEFVAGDLIDVILNMMTAVFYLVIIFLYNWQMTLIGLADVGICVLCVVLTGKVVANAAMKDQMFSGKLYGAVCGGLTITDTIKASGMEAAYTNRLLGHQTKAMLQSQELARFQQMLGILPDVLNKLTDVLLLLVGGWMAIHGYMTIGMLVAFNSMFDSFCQPVNELVGFFSNIQKMKSNLQRTEDVENYPEIQRVQGKNTVFRLNGKIELRNVAFGYSRNKPALIENFNVKVYPGESVAFVGPSGCGKSTVAKLISGLYPVWNGEVLIDQTPIDQIPSSVLYRGVAVVSQSISLFSGTIRENISMWNQSVTMDDIYAAAKDACIHDDIVKLSNGYEHLLEEKSVMCSPSSRGTLHRISLIASSFSS